MTNFLGHPSTLRFPWWPWGHFSRDTSGWSAKPTEKLRAEREWQKTKRELARDVSFFGGAASNLLIIYWCPIKNGINLYLKRDYFSSGGFFSDHRSFNEKMVGWIVMVRSTVDLWQGIGVGMRDENKMATIGRTKVLVGWQRQFEIGMIIWNDM